MHFPDPVRSLNYILGKKYPELVVLPNDRMDDVDEYLHNDLTGNNIWKGKLKSLFKNIELVRYNSNIEVSFNSLVGKFLVILCIPAPLANTISVADGCRALIDSYAHLRRLGFEIILVVHMREGYEYAEYVFSHLFSAFPCLAIPFSDSKARTDICSSIGLSQAIVVNPDGVVLCHPNSLELFQQYGTEWAHFFLTSDGTDCSRFMNNTFDAIQDKDEELMSRLDPIYALIQSGNNSSTLAGKPLPLYDILQCDPFSNLHRCDPHVGAFSQVKDLANKYVGLYLCVDGFFMEQLKAVHDHCLAKKQELEIVVVGVSLYDDPESFSVDLLEALQLCNIKLWFLFYPNHKVLRRIWRIYGQGFCSAEDRFIIIPPNGESGELEGKAVIQKIGMDKYPFTRSTILKQRLEALRSLTPDKLFNQAVMVRKGKTFEYNKLEGKKLLIYLDYVEEIVNNSQPVYHLLSDKYSKIIDMGWEVVFVPLESLAMPSYLLGNELDHVPWNELRHMPWPYIPYSDSVCVVGQLTFPEEKNGRYTNFLIGVGEGGRILSRHVEDQLESLLDQSISPDLLEQELAIGLFRLTDEMYYYC